MKIGNEVLVSNHFLDGLNLKLCGLNYGKGCCMLVCCKIFPLNYLTLMFISNFWWFEYNEL